MRTPFVVGNWKMHKSIGEALALVTELKNQLSSVKGVAYGVAPPSVPRTSTMRLPAPTPATSQPRCSMASRPG